MNKKKASDVLKEALKRVQKGWTQHTSARDKQGRELPTRSRKAVQWCAVGAITSQSRVDYLSRGKSDAIERSFRYLKQAIDHRVWVNVAIWNDDPARIKDEVVAAFKAAIEIAVAQKD